jgi:hypothetical protein
VHFVVPVHFYLECFAIFRALLFHLWLDYGSSVWLARCGKAKISFLYHFVIAVKEMRKRPSQSFKCGYLSAAQVAITAFD